MFVLYHTSYIFCKYSFKELLKNSCFVSFWTIVKNLVNILFIESQRAFLKLKTQDDKDVRFSSFSEVPYFLRNLFFKKFIPMCKISSFISPSPSLSSREVMVFHPAAELRISPIFQVFIIPSLFAFHKAHISTGAIFFRTSLVSHSPILRFWAISDITWFCFPQRICHSIFSPSFAFIFHDEKISQVCFFVNVSMSPSAPWDVFVFSHIAPKSFGNASERILDQSFVSTQAFFAIFQLSSGEENSENILDISLMFIM